MFTNKNEFKNVSEDRQFDFQISINESFELILDVMNANINYLEYLLYI